MHDTSGSVIDSTWSELCGTMEQAVQRDGPFRFEPKYGQNGISTLWTRLSILFLLILLPPGYVFTCKGECLKTPEPRTVTSYSEMSLVTRPPSGWQGDLTRPDWNCAEGLSR